MISLQRIDIRQKMGREEDLHAMACGGCILCVLRLDLSTPMEPEWDNLWEYLCVPVLRAHGSMWPWPQVMGNSQQVGQDGSVGR